MVWSPVGDGPAALASPRARRPDVRLPAGCRGMGGAQAARPVVASDEGRGARLAGRPSPDDEYLLS